MAKVVFENGEYFLDSPLDKSWLTEQKRTLVTTNSLRNAFVPDLPFVNTDGSQLIIDKDYSGSLRNKENPSPGPFEITKSGRQRIRVF